MVCDNKIMNSWFQSHFQAVLGGLFLFVGAPFLLFGVVVIVRNQQLLSVAERISGRVIEIVSARNHEGHTMYHPVIKYQNSVGADKVWEPSSSTSWSKFQLNDAVVLLIDPNNQNRIALDSFDSLWLFPLVFGSIGIVLCMIGLGVVLASIKHRSDNAWLKANGQIVEAQYVRLVDANVVVNGRRPHQLMCQWNNSKDGKVYTFLSDNVWFDPSTYLMKDQTIKVVVDPNNPAKYWMDLSFLPKPGN